MSKDIKEYIHFYLRQECVNDWFPPDHSMYNYRWRLTGIDLSSEKPYKLENDVDYSWTTKVKPILRKLESMTEEEMKDLYCCHVWARCTKSAITEIGFYNGNTNCIRFTFTAKLQNFTNGIHSGHDQFYLNSISSYQFEWLISNGFDVFNLINRGLAIDKETLKG